MVFGKRFSSSKPTETETPANLEAPDSPQPTKDDDGEYVEPQKVSALIGGSGISLDGQSLILPDCHPDDISSINTNTVYDWRGEMRILGTSDHDEEVPQSGGPRSQAQNTSKDYGKKGDAEKSVASDDSDDGGCLPIWITEAPTWLKLVIVLSTALLVGAIVLICVGAALAVQGDTVESNGTGGGTTVAFPTGSGFPPPVASPPTGSTSPSDPSDSTSTVAPTSPAAPTSPDAPISTIAPIAVDPSEPAGSPVTPATSEPTGTAPTGSTPTGTAPIQTSPPTFSPTAKTITSAPTAAPIVGTATPTVPVTPDPTQMPTSSPTSSTVSFFVTGGRFTGDALAALPEQLTTLPNLDGNSIMFHLGDWNSPFATSCVESSYQDNVALYRNSSIPVYFIPGDNEFNDCPNPTQAFDFWYQYILGFETKYWPAPTAWSVTRQVPDYRENLAYVFNGLLIVGINLVGGNVHDSQEWDDRHAANIAWIDENYNKFQGEFRAMVILAHADPEIQANENFFDLFYDRVANDYQTQVIYIHRNLGVESWGLQQQYNNLSNLIVVVVEGSIWPPMLVEIDTIAGQVDINQDRWYDAYAFGKK